MKWAIVHKTIDWSPLDISEIGKIAMDQVQPKYKPCVFLIPFSPLDRRNHLILIYLAFRVLNILRVQTES